MSTVQLIIQALIIYGPAAAAAIKAVLMKEDPTKEDWDAVFNAAAQKSYDDYIAIAIANRGI
jgi:hypothetical protein